MKKGRKDVVHCFVEGGCRDLMVVGVDEVGTELEIDVTKDSTGTEGGSVGLGVVVEDDKGTELIREVDVVVGVADGQVTEGSTPESKVLSIKSARARNLKRRV
jgi:hypothetical protein